MSISLQDILSKLPTLSSPELAEIRGRIQHLTQGNGAVNGMVSCDKDVQIVLDVIYRTMQSAGADITPPSQLQKTAQFKVMADKIVLVMSYLWDCGIRDQVKVRAVLMIAVDLLYRDLCVMGVSVSSRTIMQHFHRIPATLQKHFPGYARGKILWAIVGDKKGLVG
jgi:hypothetical protein